MSGKNFGDFFSEKFLYAIVGATTNKAKYGYRVLKDLSGAGYKVVGINPHYKNIDDIVCYSSLEELLPIPDVVVFVVPPKVGLTLLLQVKKIGASKVWFQPGAESGEIKQRIIELGLQGVADGSCIMVVRRRHDVNHNE